MKSVQKELIALLYDILNSTDVHQKTNPFCQKIFSQINSKRVNNHEIKNGRLYRDTDDYFYLLVISAYVISDLIHFFHQAYRHPKILKTTLVIKRQFYVKDLDKVVSVFIQRCVECWHSKINTRTVSPKLFI